MLPRQIRYDARFRNGVRQRFLTIDMASAAQHRCRRDGVSVIGCRHHDGIDASLIDETTEIAIAFGGRKNLHGFPQVVRIDVAQRDDILIFEVVDAELRLAGCADQSNVQLFIGGNFARRAKRRTTGKGCGDTGGAGHADKLTPVQRKSRRVWQSFAMWHGKELPERAVWSQPMPLKKKWRTFDSPPASCSAAALRNDDAIKPDRICRRWIIKSLHSPITHKWGL